ncbi:MAG: hypothetical protein DCC67_10710 [Planctomycetota bacterium]|nr:MAG: hypothetical protein DCC67_10710 [Planctomycetota bacterium]
MKTAARAHYLLFSEGTIDDPRGGSWRFVLEEVETGASFSASDVEDVECPERLELLALVRGLEAINQPAKVTLVTKSRYVSRGLKRGLADWRANSWHWERFGRVVPVRDHDLWRRVDRALQFHQVDCRLWQFGAESAPETASSAPVPRAPGRLATAARKRLQRATQAAVTLRHALRSAALAAG